MSICGDCCKKSNINDEKEIDLTEQNNEYIQLDIGEKDLKFYVHKDIIECIEDIFEKENYFTLDKKSKTSEGIFYIRAKNNENDKTCFFEMDIKKNIAFHDLKSNVVKFLHNKNMTTLRNFVYDFIEKYILSLLPENENMINPIRGPAIDLIGNVKVNDLFDKKKLELISIEVPYREFTSVNSKSELTIKLSKEVSEIFLSNTIDTPFYAIREQNDTGRSTVIFFGKNDLKQEVQDIVNTDQKPSNGKQLNIYMFLKEHMYYFKEDKLNPNAIKITNMETNRLYIQCQKKFIEKRLGSNQKKNFSRFCCNGRADINNEHKNEIIINPESNFQ